MTRPIDYQHTSREALTGIKPVLGKIDSDIVACVARHEEKGGICYLHVAHELNEHTNTVNAQMVHLRQRGILKWNGIKTRLSANSEANNYVRGAETKSKVTDRSFPDITWESGIIVSTPPKERKLSYTHHLFLNHIRDSGDIGIAGFEIERISNSISALWIAPRMNDLKNMNLIHWNGTYAYKRPLDKRGRAMRYVIGPNPDLVHQDFAVIPTTGFIMSKKKTNQVVYEFILKWSVGKTPIFQRITFLHDEDYFSAVKYVYKLIKHLQAHLKLKTNVLTVVGVFESTVPEDFNKQPIVGIDNVAPQNMAVSMRLLYKNVREHARSVKTTKTMVSTPILTPIKTIRTRGVSPNGNRPKNERV